MNETAASLREQLSEIETERADLVAEKTRLQSELSDMSADIRRNHSMPRERYQRFLSQQAEVKRTIGTLETALAQVNLKRRQVNDLLFAFGKDSNEKADKAHTLRKRIVDLRDQYIEFGSDQTRVSSMRLMATQFAQDLERLLAQERA